MRGMGYKEKTRLQAANIITFFRIVLVPFFIYALFQKGAVSGFAALLIFITAIVLINTVNLTVFSGICSRNKISLNYREVFWEN